MAVPNPGVGLQFLVSTGVEKPDPELRKLIRSHVMLGKNLGRLLQPRKRKVKKVEDTSPTNHSSPDRHLAKLPTSPTVNSRPSHPVTVPRRFGTYVSAIRFADAVEPRTVEIVLRFSSVAKHILFCLEPCIFFDRRAEQWIAPLAVDPVYLHAMIFSSQFYFDSILPRTTLPTSQRMSQHFLETLRLLRQRMANDDDKVKLCDTTVAAIMSLACHAYFTHDFNSAKHHMEGLRRIIFLRGGLSSFKESPKLLLEILRCDIGMALYNGSKPLFYHIHVSREPFLPYPSLKALLVLSGHAAANSQEIPAFFSVDINDELTHAWMFLSQFCSVINFAVDSRQRISTETFSDAMVSVVYRLLNMGFEAGSVDESIRLCLLTFSDSVFLQWKRLGMSYPHLNCALRDCFAKLKVSHIPSRLLVWLLMIGGLSVCDATDDEWLKPMLLKNIGVCQVDSWSKMQDLLKSFMWIGLVHDKPGKYIFDAAIASLDRT